MSKLEAILADLEVQSMIFDMDIDYEALSLVARSEDEVPSWIKKWREKESNGDRQPNDYQGWE